MTPEQFADVVEKGLDALDYDGGGCRMVDRKMPSQRYMHAYDSDGQWHIVMVLTQAEFEKLDAPQ